jgi:predicted transcriptional regulator
VVAPIEILPYALPFFVLLAFLLISTAIALAHDKMQSEDEAQYEYFNPSIRRARKVRNRMELTPLQATKTTVMVAKSPEKAAVSSHHPGKITLVSSVMVKTPYYCRENQSNEEALKMMRELDLPYLPVLDSNLRVVGVVSMRDLMRSKEQKDPPPSGK